MPYWCATQASATHRWILWLTRSGWQQRSWIGIDLVSYLQHQTTLQWSWTKFPGTNLVMFIASDCICLHCTGRPKSDVSISGVVKNINCKTKWKTVTSLLAVWSWKGPVKSLVRSEQHWLYNEKSLVFSQWKSTQKCHKCGQEKHDKMSELLAVLTLACCTWWSWISERIHFPLAKSHY